MKRPEQILQQHVVQFLTTAVPPPPEGPVWFAPDAGLPFHVPKGTSEEGRRQAAQHAARIGGIRKSMGVKPGIPDLVFLSARPFAIELKADEGVASDDQLRMHRDLEDVGVPVHVCCSLYEVEQTLRVMDVPLKGRILV